MNKHEKFLLLAYENTYRSNHKYPMAAVLARGKTPISIGTNRIKTHPRQKTRISPINGKEIGQHKLHAELDCLIRAPGDKIEEATIYVARRTKDAGFGLAKPCELCYSELIHYGVKRAFFTVSRPLIGIGDWYSFIEF